MTVDFSFLMLIAQDQVNLIEVIEGKKQKQMFYLEYKCLPCSKFSRNEDNLFIALKYVQLFVSNHGKIRQVLKISFFLMEN